LYISRFDHTPNGLVYYKYSYYSWRSNCCLEYRNSYHRPPNYLQFLMFMGDIIMYPMS